MKIACLEEIAYELGHIDAEQVLRRAAVMGKADYGRYLTRLVEAG